MKLNQAYAKLLFEVRLDNPSSYIVYIEKLVPCTKKTPIEQGLDLKSFEKQLETANPSW